MPDPIPGVRWYIGIYRVALESGEGEQPRERDATDTALLWAVVMSDGRFTADEKRGGGLGAAGCRPGRCAYVLVNNRAAGKALLTVQGLVEMLRG